MRKTRCDEYYKFDQLLFAPGVQLYVFKIASLFHVCWGRVKG